MDRTPVTLFFYTCPPEQTWAIARVIEQHGLTEQCDDTRASDYRTRIGPGPWELGYLEPGQEYMATEVPCGAARAIAEFLDKHAPDARWDVWEEPKYEWEGERFIHDPELGTWSQVCNSEGTPMFTPHEVRAFVVRALLVNRADRGQAQDEILATAGEPWLALAERYTDRRIIPIEGANDPRNR